MNAHYEYGQANRKKLPPKKDKFFGDPYDQGLDAVVKICLGVAAVLLLISVILIVSSRFQRDAQAETSPASASTEEIMMDQTDVDPVELIEP